MACRQAASSRGVASSISSRGRASISDAISVRRDLLFSEADDEMRDWLLAQPAAEEFIARLSSLLELVAACDDGSLPEMLSVHQVWIDPNGRLQLLGTPLTGDETKVISPDVARSPNRSLQRAPRCWSCGESHAL